jgi:hypothetical protein
MGMGDLQFKLIAHPQPIPSFDPSTKSLEDKWEGTLYQC